MNPDRKVRLRRPVTPARWAGPSARRESIVRSLYADAVARSRAMARGMARDPEVRRLMGVLAEGAFGRRP